jgi:predicted Rossmann-fold nucleotide-binding protein
MLANGTISEADLHLINIIDASDAVVDFIKENVVL